MHLVEVERLAILLVGVVSAADVDSVVSHVLLHHIPRSAAQPQALALTDGVEPESAMLADFLACLQLDDVALLLAQMAADEVVVVDFAQEAYSLAVLAVGVGQFRLLRYAPHLLLRHRADGERQVHQLLVGNLREEVGLVLHRGDRRGEIFAPVDNGGRGVVSGGCYVEVLAPTLLEVAELYHLVAHHVGVWRQPASDGAQRIFHHVVPVFLV